MLRIVAVSSVSKSAPTIHAHAVVAKPIVKHVVPAVHKTVYAHPAPIGKSEEFLLPIK